MSCRQAALKKRRNAESAKAAEHRDLLESRDLSAFSAASAFEFPKTLVRNGGHLARIERFQEVARRFEIELRILCLDAEEEPVAARQREARHVENGVVRLRQSVQRQHAEHGRERRRQNRALER